MMQRIYSSGLIFSSLFVLLVLSGCGEKSAEQWHEQAQALVEGKVLRQLDAQVLAQAEYGQEQALVLDPTSVEARFALAALYEARGAYEDAALLYRRLIERDSLLGRAYAGLGFSLAAQGRYSGAMRAYQDALRRGERSALLYTRLGHVYQALGHVQEHLLSARASYRAALQLDPEQVDAHAHLARVESRLGRRDEAVALYQQALAQESNDDEVRVELAALYREMGQGQVGRGVLAEGITRAPDSPLLHQEMGRFLWEDGDGVRAFEHFVKALAADASLVLARRYMALIYSAQGQHGQALAAYAELAQLQPQDASVHVSMGIVHSQLGDLAAAEKVFKQALELGGAGGDAALKLGGLYMHQRRLRAAVKVFKEAVESHESNAELHAALGDVYRQLGVLRAALEAGEQAVALEPERALWRYHLASTYERAYPQQAAAEWRRYAELAAGDVREVQRLREVKEKWEKQP
ncbi:MAG: tetratricopeptide repeat protein [Candidatus Latescibacterota bacterium]|jgi:tetratricopeptide (TPR) repeat protein